MRRVIAIFLLLLLPLQAVWAAVEPYCMHESAQGPSPHFGHHEHQHHASVNADVDVEADHAHQGDSTGETGESSAMPDHDDHCCAGVSLLSAAVPLPGPLPQADGVASQLATYASFDATRIERPNWTLSL